MAKNRRAMANPFVGIKKEEAAAKEGDAPAAASPHPTQRAVDAREFVGFRLSPAILERARAVAWTKRLTLTAFVEAAIETAVVVAEQENGGPFPPVPRRRRAV